MSRSRKILASAFAAVTLLGVVSDAAARRHKDCRSRQTGSLVRCSLSPAPAGPLVLQAPPTCVGNALATARATSSARVRRVTLRLDGAVVARSTKDRPTMAVAGIDCATIGEGDHVLSATLLREDGTRVEVRRTLTRSPAGLADDPFAD